MKTYRHPTTDSYIKLADIAEGLWLVPSIRPEVFLQDEDDMIYICVWLPEKPELVWAELVDVLANESGLIGLLPRIVTAIEYALNREDLR